MNVAQLETWVDPHVEWAEIFHEAWRNQRDFFYDPKMHGADWQAVLAKYTPQLASVDHRSDLGYLIAQTGGEHNNLFAFPSAGGTGEISIGPDSYQLIYDQHMRGP